MCVCTCDQGCRATRGSIRCEKVKSHPGRHQWTDEVTNEVVWWVACEERGCVEDADHELPHRNGRGTSWWPCPIEREALA